MIARSPSPVVRPIGSSSPEPSAASDRSARSATCASVSTQPASSAPSPRTRGGLSADGPADISTARKGQGAESGPAAVTCERYPGGSGRVIRRASRHFPAPRMAMNTLAAVNLTRWSAFLALALLLTVAAPASAKRQRADLVVKSVEAPASVTAGSTFAAPVVVKNKGKRKAGRSKVAFALSATARAGSGGVALGDRSVPKLKPGKKSRRAPTRRYPRRRSPAPTSSSPAPTNRARSRRSRTGTTARRPGASSPSPPRPRRRSSRSHRPRARSRRWSPRSVPPR